MRRVCPEGFIEVVADSAEGQQMGVGLHDAAEAGRDEGVARSDAATATSDAGK